MSAAPRPTVSDWAEDFDHTDPAWDAEVLGELAALDRPSGAGW